MNDCKVQNTVIALLFLGVFAMAGVVALQPLRR